MTELETKMTAFQKQLLVVVFVLITGFICFWNLGNEPLRSWDESLYGINAYEMIQKNDWVNPYYQGEPDQWNVKPPLAFIPIIVDYHIFGFNGWGLRFHSALAAFVLVMVFFRFVWFEKGLLRATLTTSILIGCTALIGEHSGRGGDTDATLSLLIFAGIASVYRHSITKKDVHLICAAISFGVAFLVKSTAVFLFLPAVFVFLLLNRNLRSIVYSYSGWMAVVVFMVFPSVWLLIHHYWGITFDATKFAGSSSIANSFLYDSFERITGTGGFETVNKKHDFILTFLDSRFNIWHIPFFITVGTLFFQLIRSKIWKVKEEASKNPLVLLSLSTVLTVMAILQVSATVNGWYLIPLTPFLALIVADGFEKLSQRVNHAWALFAILSLFTVGRHVYQKASLKNEPSYFFEILKAKMPGNNCLHMDRALHPDQILRAQWATVCQKHVKIGPDRQFQPDEILLTTKKIGAEKADLIAMENGLHLYQFH